MDASALAERIPAAPSRAATTGEGSTTAARFELKYWASEAQAAALLRMADPHVVPDPMAASAGPRGAWNVSLYLDSPRLHFLEQHLASAPDRVKLRVRTYTNDGPRPAPPRERSGEPAFLEIKRKVGMLTLKQRTVVSRGDATAIVARRFDEARCLDGALERDLEAFLFLQERYAVRPTMLVRARRQSLLGHDDEGSFRLTLDRDISYQRATGQTAAVDLDGRPRGWSFVETLQAVLIELKFCGAAPGWLGPLMARLGLDRNAFSKYVAALGQELGGPGAGLGARAFTAISDEE